MVQISGYDRYGRTLGRVYLDNRDINRELVEEGHAWGLSAVSHRPGFLNRRSSGSRPATRPVGQPLTQSPPWDWRRGKREAHTQGRRPG